MIGFEWPWLALLLPLPYFIYRYARPWNAATGSALRAPFPDDFIETEPGAVKKARAWPLWLALAAWSLLVFSAMRPQWLGELVEVPVTGRELMLAVDLSGSMEQQDFVLGGRRIEPPDCYQAGCRRFHRAPGRRPDRPDPVRRTGLPAGAADV